MIFARHAIFADELARRITALGVFNLRKARIGFRKVRYSEIPPYEIEMEQLDTVEGYENKNINEK